MTEAVRVLVTCPQMRHTLPHFQGEFDRAGVLVDAPPVVQAMSEDELSAAIAPYDGMIAGDDAITDRVLASATRLRVISKWGVGVDGIDRDAAAKRGVVVTNTPGMFGDEVADLAMCYVLLLARRVHEIDRAVRRGDWLKVEGITLSGEHLGVIGLGSIGRALAKRAHAFGLKVLAHDVEAMRQGDAETLGVTCVGLEELLRESRFVVLCCPLTEANRHMLSDAQFAMMRSDAFVVNVARGPLVDEQALATALVTGSLAGAALDVFETEPLPRNSKLHELDAVILGSHNGSNTASATMRVSALAVQHLLMHLKVPRVPRGVE